MIEAAEVKHLPHAWSVLIPYEINSVGVALLNLRLII